MPPHYSNRDSVLHSSWIPSSIRVFRTATNPSLADSVSIFVSVYTTTTCSHHLVERGQNYSVSSTHSDIHQHNCDTFVGSANGTIMGGGRVIYAAAVDGYVPAVFGKVQTKT